MMDKCPPRSYDESARLEALHGYAILDTPVEQEFDDFTRLAAAICDAPVSLISLVDKNRQWFKSRVGITLQETPLDRSICRHAILHEGLFVVPDTRLDARFATNPLVTGEPYFRFYAGAALETSEGLPLGTLCVLDHQPRELTPAQQDTLRILARQVMTALELRKAAVEIAAKNRELEAAARKIQTLEGLLPICSGCKKMRDEQDQWLSVETYLQRHTGAQFTHGLCPTCIQTYLDDLNRRQVK